MIKANEFVDLHLHTEYSLLDQEPAAFASRCIKRIKELGQTAVAITDHGNMYGAVEFWNEARKEGIKPIIGACEVYVARRSRFDKEPETRFIAVSSDTAVREQRGLQEPCKARFHLRVLRAFYSKPRVDTELLKKYHGGLICMSACYFGGNTAFLLAADDYEGAKSCALAYREIFGEGNYFFEIQNHGISDEQKVTAYLYRLSRDYGNFACSDERLSLYQQAGR